MEILVKTGSLSCSYSFYSNPAGIKCAVIEKNVKFTRHPRAHFINNRTMEVCMLTNALQRCYLIFMCVVLGGGFTGGWHFQIFRKLDGLAGDIERSQPPVDLWRKFVYCTSLSGSVLGSVDHMKPEGQSSSSDVEQCLAPLCICCLTTTFGRF